MLYYIINKYNYFIKIAYNEGIKLFGGYPKKNLAS